MARLLSLPTHPGSNWDSAGSCTHMWTVQPARLCHLHTPFLHPATSRLPWALACTRWQCCLPSGGTTGEGTHTGPGSRLRAGIWAGNCRILGAGAKCRWGRLLFGRWGACPLVPVDPFPLWEGHGWRKARGGLLMLGAQDRASSGQMVSRAKQGT